MQEAHRTADALVTLANLKLDSVAKEVQDAIGDEGENFMARTVCAPRGSATAKYYYHQIIQCAKALKYFANLPAYQAWAVLKIRTDHQTEILFSFHGIGQGATGVIGCAPMLFTRDRNGAGETDVSEPTPLADAPFEFTYVESAEEVRKRFGKWLDECVLNGLDIWRKTV